MNAMKFYQRVLVCMQHQLTPEQVSELQGLGDREIKYLRDEDSELFNQLANSPADPFQLAILAERLKRTIKAGKYNWVVLPIGSPSFMFILSQRVINMRRVIFLFANSIRVSEERKKEAGSIEKVSAFKHIEFIKINSGQRYPRLDY